MQFIFCHGFAFNNNFWNNLFPYFAKEKCTFLELGYFAEPKIYSRQPGEPIVGIGHSLGLIKLMNFYQRLDCLIGLNGFINFLGGTDQLKAKRQLEFDKLTSQLIKNPFATLKSFYQRCGVPLLLGQVNKQAINLERLLADLQLLTLPHPPRTVPMLILAANDDRVVPQSLVADNFLAYANVKIDLIDDGKHALGFLKAHEVYDKIVSFIHDSIAFIG